MNVVKTRSSGYSGEPNVSSGRCSLTTNLMLPSSGLSFATIVSEMNLHQYGLKNKTRRRTMKRFIVVSCVVVTTLVSLVIFSNGQRVRKLTAADESVVLGGIDVSDCYISSYGCPYSSTMTPTPNTSCETSLVGSVCGSFGCSDPQNARTCVTRKGSFFEWITDLECSPIEPHMCQNMLVTCSSNGSCSTMYSSASPVCGEATQCVH